MTAPVRDDIESWYRGFQADFAAMIEAVDGTADFFTDEWDRPEGGGGVTRILAGSGPIEKAAVNFSAVEGPTPPRLSEAVAAESNRFYATGVSIIVHPANPFAPAFHANVRYFETDAGTAWFGGGADLTPHYFFEEDAVAFHRALADACAAHPSADYAAWKKACDEYFYLQHRDERRGVGGLFFDHLSDLEPAWRFQRDFAAVLAPVYETILRRRIDAEFGPQHRHWQLLRRGRYAEFNLVWDRGTRFGLETNGRTESILASLPPLVAFDYGVTPEAGTPEAELLDVLTGEPRAWLS